MQKRKNLGNSKCDPSYTVTVTVLPGKHKRHSSPKLKAAEFIKMKREI